MAKIEIRKNSWLNFADLLDFEGTQGTSGIVEETQTISFWDTPDFPRIVPQDDDFFVTIDDKMLGRLDLIAYDAYGDADMWWVLALANGYDLIPTDMVINEKMRVPSKSYIDSLIGRGQQR